MPADRATHPSPETLQALEQGQLNDAQAEAVLAHLRSCADCSAAATRGGGTAARLVAPQAGKNTVGSGRTPSAQSTPTQLPPSGQSPPGTGGHVARPGAGSRPFPREFPADFGRYRILKRLGEGGMGAVYLAHDTQLDRPVALKVPHFEADDGPQVLERFQREARAAATVHHPNVCPVHDVGDVGGTPYLTMAYVEGKPLSDFAATKPPTARASALLVRKLALALQEAHRRGVIHRDLKPANVMIDRRGEPVIMDFGLARRTRAKDARLTQDGAVMGTPSYMSPEQVRGDLQAVGAASDLYSLGVILYELLTGRLPFTGNVMQVLSQVLMDEPPPPRSLIPALDPALEGICLKAMAKQKEDRYGSMGEFAAALTDYLRSGTAGGDVAPPPPKSAAPPTQNAAGGGIRVSQMGGMRSVAMLNARVPAARAAKTERPRRRRPKRERRRRVPSWAWPAAGGLGVAVLLVAAVVVLRVRTGTGEVVIETDDPDVEVVVKQAGRQIEVLDLKTRQKVELPSGEYEVALGGGKPGLRLSTDAFTLKRGGQQIVTVRRVPAPAVAEAATKDRAGPPAKTPEPAASPRPTVPGPPAPPDGGQPARPALTARLWCTFEGEPGMNAAVFSPDGRRLVSWGGTTARVWDVATGKELRRFPGHVSYVDDAVFTPDGRLLTLDGWGEPAMHLWDVTTGREMARFGRGVTPRFWSAKFAPDGRTLITGAEEGAVLVWDLGTGKVVRRFLGHARQAVVSVRLSADGKYAASVCSRDRTVRLWDVQSGRELGLTGTMYGTSQVSFLPGSRRLLVGARDYSARLCDLETGQVVQTFRGHTASITHTAFTPDGRFAVTAAGVVWKDLGKNAPAADPNVRVWDVATGREVLRIENGAGGVVWMDLSPDGRQVLTGSLDSLVRLWQLPEL